MNDKMRKRLTIFMGECWHEWVRDYNYVEGIAVSEYNLCYTCKKCPQPFIPPKAQNRTFTTETDMMALYKRLYEVKRWGESDFCDFALQNWEKGHRHDDDPFSFDAWLFCLNGEGYEERCEMVDEFLQGELKIVQYSYENLKGIDES